jgi:hypothetical protein
MGYADTRRYLGELPPRGVALDPHATRMKAPRRGVAFREQLEGHVELAPGEQKRASGARRVTLSAAVDIPELAHFVEQGAALYGSIDVEGLGERLPLFDGHFRLVTDAQHPGVTLSAAFSAGGVDYRFSAERSAGLARGGNFGEARFRIFRAHALDVTAADGVAAAFAEGTLATLHGLPALVASLRSVGTQGPLEAAEVMLEFAALYGGEACAAAFRPKKKPWWQFW